MSIAFKNLGADGLPGAIGPPGNIGKAGPPGFPGSVCHYIFITINIFILTVTNIIYTYYF